MRLDDLRHGRTLVLGYGREARSLERVVGTKMPDADLSVYADQRPVDPPAAWPLHDTADAAWSERPARLLRSAGVPLHHPLVERARAEGVPTTCITSLWFGERRDASVIAVTGSKGKSTTAAMIAHLLEGSGVRVALGGNIGIPMLELLDSRPEWFVVELSSYQLADLVGHADIGVFTRLFPEHQDWHRGVAPYYAAKLRLADLLDGRPLFFNAADPVLAAALAGRTGLTAVNRGVEGLHARPDGLWRDEARVMRGDAWGLQGRHNLDNAALALAAVEAVVGRVDDAGSRLSSFRPLPHRLSPVDVRGGVHWINDSISTTPHAALAALQAVGPGTVLIVGGMERGADWSEVAAWCRRQPLAGLVALPDNGERIARRLIDAGAVDPDRYRAASDIEVAVEAAWSLSRSSGRTVLLSPGAPSFPRFRDFEERGHRFERAVRRIVDGDGR